VFKSMIEDDERPVFKSMIEDDERPVFKSMIEDDERPVFKSMIEDDERVVFSVGDEGLPLLSKIGNVGEISENIVTTLKKGEEFEATRVDEEKQENFRASHQGKEFYAQYGKSDSEGAWYSTRINRPVGSSTEVFFWAWNDETKGPTRVKITQG